MDGRRDCESIKARKLLLPSVLSIPIDISVLSTFILLYCQVGTSLTFLKFCYFVQFLSPMLSFRYIFLSSPYRFWFKPPNPPMTSPSTSTTAGSWTAARAWTTSALTPPTPSCTLRAKPAACQGCFIWHRGANSPSES